MMLCMKWKKKVFSIIKIGIPLQRWEAVVLLMFPTGLMSCRNQAFDQKASHSSMRMRDPEKVNTIMIDSVWRGNECENILINQCWYEESHDILLLHLGMAICPSPPSCSSHLVSKRKTINFDEGTSPDVAPISRTPKFSWNLIREASKSRSLPCKTHGLICLVLARRF